MKRDDAQIPFDDRGPDELIDAYFDRELAPETEAQFARRLARDADLAMRFAESEEAVEAIGRPIQTPDLSSQILAEVGRRRGWIGARLQRLVSVGRVAIAAAILLALAVTLTVRRLTPDAAIFPQAPTPIADVADCAASDANCNVAEFLTAMDHVGSQTRLNAVRQSFPKASAQAMAATCIRIQIDTQSVSKTGAHARSRTDHWRARCVTVRPMTLSASAVKSESLKKLTAQQRVGVVRFAALRTSARPSDNDDKASTVGGW